MACAGTEASDVGEPPVAPDARTPGEKARAYRGKDLSADFRALKTFDRNVSASQIE
jgi:hypothetical protein